MIMQKYVEEYIELYRNGKVKFNKEREQLIEYLEEYVLNRDDLRWYSKTGTQYRDKLFYIRGVSDEKTV